MQTRDPSASPPPGPAAAVLRLRRAGAADADALAALAERLFRETYGPTSREEDLRAYVAATFGPAAQAAELADAAMLSLLAETGGRPVGYAQMRLPSAPPATCDPGGVAAELGRLYVERAWHGRGAGQALLDACADHARRAGARALWLCVWRQNARATAFYRRAGFAVCGAAEFRLGGELQWDDVMIRTLEPLNTP